MLTVKHTNVPVGHGLLEALKVTKYSLRSIECY